jgi:hypothetical protein
MTDEWAGLRTRVSTRSPATTTAPPDNLVSFPVTTPVDAARRRFLMLDRTISAVAKRGTKKCRKVTMRILEKLGEQPSGVLRSLYASAPGWDTEAREVLDARCLVCPAKCDRKLT